MLLRAMKTAGFHTVFHTVSDVLQLVLTHAEMKISSSEVTANFTGRCEKNECDPKVSQRNRTEHWLEHEKWVACLL